MHTWLYLTYSRLYRENINVVSSGFSTERTSISATAIPRMRGGGGGGGRKERERERQRHREIETGGGGGDGGERERDPVCSHPFPCRWGLYKYLFTMMSTMPRQGSYWFSQ